MENIPPHGNTPCLESVELQLSVCRAMLAAAYRDGNAAEAALAVAEAELDHLRNQGRIAHILLRTWLLRVRTIRPSNN